MKTLRKSRKRKKIRNLQEELKAQKLQLEDQKKQSQCEESRFREQLQQRKINLKSRKLKSQKRRFLKRKTRRESNPSKNLFQDKRKRRRNLSLLKQLITKLTRDQQGMIHKRNLKKTQNKNLFQKTHEKKKLFKKRSNLWLSKQRQLMKKKLKIQNL